MYQNDYFKYLNVGLPENIQRYKLAGYFDKAVELIDRKLGDEGVPEALRNCLVLQRELILRLPADFRFTMESGLARVQEEIPDFTMEELQELMDSDRIDWIYVNGEVHLVNSFVGTLKKTYPAFANRCKSSAVGGIEGNAAAKMERRAEMRAMIREKGSQKANLRIRASVRIKDEAFEPGKLVRVHLPLPIACEQQSNIVIHDTYGTPTHIAAEDAEQRTIYWEEVMQENHEFWVEYSYDYTATYCDPFKVIPDAVQPTFDTEEIQPQIVFTPFIRSMVEELTLGLTSPIEKAKAFYDFTTKRVRYSFMRAYFGLENIPENCARNTRGDCGVQTLLFITLCRCAGIPCQWQTGLFSEPGDVGAHDWCRFYVAPYGWMLADLSFGGSAFREGDEERHAFYFGNLDCYRTVANRQFQAEFDPPKMHWRADPYDNQYGEIEYEDHGLRFGDYVRDQHMVEFTLLD